MATSRSDPYRDAASLLQKETGVAVRKWRRNMTGVAFTRADDWGIESPAPNGPVSFGVFAHEVGHQMLHRNNSLPRWVEEIEAWEYALAQFDRFQLPGRDKCVENARKCLGYSAKKAWRRAGSETRKKMQARYPDWAQIDLWDVNFGPFDNGAEIRFHTSAASLGKGVACAIGLGAFLAHTIT